MKRWCVRDVSYSRKHNYKMYTSLILRKTYFQCSHCNDKIGISEYVDMCAAESQRIITAIIEDKGETA